MEKLSLYLKQTLEKHEKFLENSSKFLLIKVLMKTLQRHLPHCQMQTSGCDRGKTHLWGTELKSGGGNCPFAHAGYNPAFYYLLASVLKFTV